MAYLWVKMSAEALRTRAVEAALQNAAGGSWYADRDRERMSMVLAAAEPFIRELVVGEVAAFIDGIPDSGLEGLALHLVEIRQMIEREFGGSR